MDNLTPVQRRRTMAAVKSQDTTIEIAVRSVVHRLGFRFRLHRVDLPGNPDLAFPRYRAVIFVHGCFWHGHNCRRGRRVPATNRVYWVDKVARNVARDRRVRRALKLAGWRSLVIWECEIPSRRLGDRIRRFLDG